METEDDRKDPDHTEKDFSKRIRQLEAERDAAINRLGDLERELSDRDIQQGTLYGVFFANAAVGMVEMDPDGRFLRANETFCRISGYAWEELVQLTMQELTHPDDREEDLRKFTAFQNGLTPTYETEKRYLRKDGRIGWIQVSAGRGSPRRTAAVVCDITLQKEAEAALQEAENRLKLALEASGIGSWELDLVKSTVWRTSRHDRIFGYDSLLPEWNYDIFLEHVVAEDREEVDRKFREALDGGETWNFECRILRADGEPRWIWAQGRIHRDEKGRPLRMYGLVADVTDRKILEENLQEAQQAAEEASRAKSEFLANMSHEIRTPMTVFMAALDHLLQIDESPERRPFLEMADHAAQRLRALIDDILDFSRIEARRLDIQEEPFDLRVCVRNAVEMMELKTRDKNLRLATNISPDIPSMVIGDKDRLGQVLINLVGNAVKFTMKGEVKISVRPRGDNIAFAVSDTGIGIPKEKRDLLFESFSQADSSLTRKFGGTGLGLAISKGLVELMGGRIGVRSRPGRGSVFSFTLPLKPADAFGASPVQEMAEIPEALFPEARILIADDEPMIRTMVLMTLAQRGWRADIAVTGREAVQKCEEGNFDVVFMDLQMPEMDGLEATRRIREAESGRKICIVGLTAHARPEVREECLEAGMDKVLTKPVRMKELYAAIDECLEA